MSNQLQAASLGEKHVHFVSLGCPKNLVDSEIMLGHLTGADYKITPSPENADVIIVNTCGFIDASKQESIQTILEMAEYKRGPKAHMKLVVAGCLTQRYRDELVESLPEADLFIGTGEFHKITDILTETEKLKSQKKFFSLPTYLQEDSSPRVNTQPFYTAYTKISEGCLKRCAFCAIPKIRGNIQSRKLESIVNEAHRLVATGVRELNVVSHDFTDFGWDLRRRNPEAQENPVTLLRALSEVKGLDWIRVLYLYPDGITPELVELIKSKSNLAKYFDMPLQHISNSVLKRMNRKMTQEEIREVIKLIRTEIPDAVIRTQFIVGFPGETEEDFQQLLEFVKEMRFDRVGCFEYSPEDVTPAGTMPDQIDDAVKRRRQAELMSLQQEISRDVHRRYVGQTLPVLVEGFSEETDLLLKGRTREQAPEIDGHVLISSGTPKVGDIVNVRITESMDYDLVGEIVDESGQVLSN
ncbi:MAG: 30S ribosomal protein S12 methylthiotransferase RimO [Oligoflexia bacterium]|nr:30S ribosomal protein S12 methylthiotransferase RimO [Oligoflexia bacterium]